MGKCIHAKFCMYMSHKTDSSCEEICVAFVQSCALQLNDVTLDRLSFQRTHWAVFTKQIDLKLNFNAKLA